MFFAPRLFQFGQAGPHLAMFSLLWRSWQRVGLIILRSRVRSSPGAVIFFPLGKNLRRFVVFVFGPLAVVLVGWPSGPRR